MRNQNCACFIFVCDVADWLSYLFIYLQIVQNNK